MYCYLLFSGRQTYIGATVDPDRRLRQHNGEITGGARRTHGLSWQRACYVSGFPTWNAALQFEWAWKRHGRGKPRLEGKLEALWNLLHTERSTGNALPFRFWSRPLSVVFNTDIRPFLNKIDCVRRLDGIIIPTMSTPDITALALRVEELALQVQQLQNQLAARPASAAAPKKRASKKAAVAAVPAVAAEGATVAAAAPKKRGPKKATASATDEPADGSATASASASTAAAPKKRGPKKTAAAAAPAAESSESSAAVAPETASPPAKKRGPKKVAAADATPVANLLSA
jgi:structure-specific endonuclease subunit SLX1